MQLPTPPLPPDFVSHPSGFLEFVMLYVLFVEIVLLASPRKTQQPDSGNSVPDFAPPAVAVRIERHTGCVFVLALLLIQSLRSG
jgi:hypothetical protein